MRLSLHIELSLSPPTVSKLSLTSALSLTGGINTDVEIKCSVLVPTSPSSRYAVTWRLLKEDGNKILLTSDESAVVTFGPELGQSARQRMGAMRSEGPTFQLFIRHAQISDAGSYTCDVVEWLQDPQNHWYPLPLLSRTIVLTLTEPGVFNDKSADTIQTLNNVIDFSLIIQKMTFRCLRKSRRCLRKRARRWSFAVISSPARPALRTSTKSLGSTPGITFPARTSWCSWITPGC